MSSRIGLRISASPPVPGHQRVLCRPSGGRPPAHRDQAQAGPRPRPIDPLQPGRRAVAGAAPPAGPAPARSPCRPVGRWVPAACPPVARRRVGRQTFAHAGHRIFEARGVEGLDRGSRSRPARTCTAYCSNAVTNTIRARPAMARPASTPFIPGMCTSRNTTCGCSRRTAPPPRGPLRACATTANSGHSRARWVCDAAQQRPRRRRSVRWVKRWPWEGACQAGHGSAVGQVVGAQGRRWSTRRRTIGPHR